MNLDTNPLMTNPLMGNPDATLTSLSEADPYTGFQYIFVEQDNDLGGGNTSDPWNNFKVQTFTEDQLRDRYENSITNFDTPFDTFEQYRDYMREYTELVNSDPSLRWWEAGSEAMDTRDYAVNVLGMSGEEFDNLEVEMEMGATGAQAEYNDLLGQAEAYAQDARQEAFTAAFSNEAYAGLLNQYGINPATTNNDGDSWFFLGSGYNELHEVDDHMGVDDYLTVAASVLVSMVATPALATALGGGALGAAGASGIVNSAIQLATTGGIDIEDALMSAALSGGLTYAQTGELIGNLPDELGAASQSGLQDKLDAMIANGTLTDPDLISQAQTVVNEAVAGMGGAGGSAILDNIIDVAVAGGTIFGSTDISNTPGTDVIGNIVLPELLPPYEAPNEEETNGGGSPSSDAGGTPSTGGSTGSPDTTSGAVDDPVGDDNTGAAGDSPWVYQGDGVVTNTQTGEYYEVPGGFGDYSVGASVPESDVASQVDGSGDVNTGVDYEAPTQEPDDTEGVGVVGVGDVTPDVSPDAAPDVTPDTTPDTTTQPSGNTYVPSFCPSGYEDENGVCYPVGTTPNGTGSGSGSGDGTGNGDGSGDSNGDGGGDGLFGGGGDKASNAPTWSELFPYTTVNVAQKTKLKPYVSSLRKTRGLFS